MTDRSHETADLLDSLLRGEISAAETYTQTLRTLERHAAAPRLETLRSDHVVAANLLRRHVNARGEDSSTSSGAWGTFAKAVEGTAKALGETSALEALKQGEEHGLKEYEDALGKGDLDFSARELISMHLLPAQRRHVAALESLLATTQEP